MSYLEEEQYNKPFSFKVWFSMLPFFKPYKKQISKLIYLMLVVSIIDVFIPIYQKYIIDNFIVKHITNGIWLVVACGVFIILMQSIITIIFTRTALAVEMSFARDLKKALFDHLQSLSLSYYNTTPVGYMISRVMSDTSKIGEMVAWGLVQVMWSISYIIFAIVAMLLLDWRLGIIMIIIVPIMALVTFWFQNRILKYNRKVRQTNSKITSAFNEGILGARTSKTLVIEDINSADFAKITHTMFESSVKAASLSAIYLPTILMFGSIAVAIILVQGSGYVVSGTMQYGTLTAMISYGLGIFAPIQQLARIYTDIIGTQANIERVDALLEKKPDIIDSEEVLEKYGDSFNPKPENWEPLEGSVKFENVTFKYPDGNENVLENFNLDVPFGSSIAIVGETGAGKSTLVNLVCRFYEPTSGKVLIDGKDYRKRSQLWLHSNIGYVLQSPHLFSGTVRDNIRYGKLDATDDEIMAAAALVSADKVIEKLQYGLDSDVGEGGDKLSTGEKQLISFARAVLSNPRIFVLDEATASIDTDTELLIQNAIANILQNRTSFLIAHRLSTIKMADLILVVRDGKIIEQGTHNELLKQKGYYLELYTMQQQKVL